MNEAVIYTWPESQGCTGCKHAHLENEAEHGPSAYSCGIGFRKGNTIVINKDDEASDCPEHKNCKSL